MAVPVMIIDGDVIATHSYWTDDGARIMTDATVQTADGRQVVVTQFGGVVDGIGMRIMSGPDVMEPGMHVAVAAHKDLDLSQAEHVVLDTMKVSAYPPDYVRTTGPNKEKLYWESGCAIVTVDSAGTAAIAGDGEFPIIDASINEWNTRTASCSSFKLMNAGRKSLEVGNDGVNLIKFRDTVWGLPAAGNAPAVTHSPQAAAITTATYISDPKSARDGAIVDADIELNGVNFTIAASPSDPPVKGCLAVLENTLTHELGHLHGLEHTCYLGATDPGWVDNHGDPVPSCSPLPPATLPASIVDATMYPTQDCGETKKATLSPDDIQAMCDIYPASAGSKACTAPPKSTGGGCCSASSGEGTGVSMLLAGVTLLGMRRRRKVSRAA